MYVLLFWLMSGFYPENLLPLIKDEPQPPYEAFAELREQVLVDYRYNTARAYWADLDDVYMWSVRPDLGQFRLWSMVLMR